MISRQTILSTCAAAGLVAGGCGSNELDDPDHVRAWVNTGSAVAVYGNAHGPIAFADGRAPYPDPACPMTSDDGTVAIVSGGCTDETGTTWEGTATVTRGSGGERVLSLDDFAQFDDADLRAATSGTITVRPMTGSLSEYVVDIVTEGGLTTSIDYAGTVEGDYDGPTVWNGDGEVSRDGFGEPTGVVRMTTTDEVLDDAVCSGQPVSGETRIDGDGHFAVVTYDGATDCDDDHAARWSVDGEDRGRITGITCTASPPSANAPLAPALLLLAGLVRLRRRRTNATPKPPHLTKYRPA